MRGDSIVHLSLADGVIFLGLNENKEELATLEATVDRLQGYLRSAAASNTGSGLAWHIERQVALAERLLGI